MCHPTSEPGPGSAAASQIPGAGSWGFMLTVFNHSFRMKKKNQPTHHLFSHWKSALLKDEVAIKEDVTGVLSISGSLCLT